MRRGDYILAITSGLLTVSEEGFDAAVTYFSKLYELQQPARPGYVSLASVSDNHELVNYLQWLREIRAAGVKAIHFYYSYEAKDHSLPAHIEAAFAGTQTLLMQVSTSRTTTTWWLRTMLSPQYEIAPQQFIELIDAQDKKDVLWNRVEELVNESNVMNSRPEVAAGEVALYLQSTEGREVYNFLVSDLVTEAQVECKVLETPFGIPDHLKSLLYQSDFQFPEDNWEPPGDPNELENKRARARSRLSSTQWYLQGIQQPWEMYVFTPVEMLSGASPERTAAVKEQFIDSLQQIAAFAKKIDSPFAEAFQVSEFLLTHDLPSGDFDEEHEKSIVTVLQKKGFSDQAIQAFQNNFSYTKDLHLLQWPAERIFGLCAVSLADVFGGMGSWNDVYPGEDQETYQQLSARLFESMKRYFAVVISV